MFLPALIIHRPQAKLPLNQGKQGLNVGVTRSSALLDKNNLFTGRRGHPVCLYVPLQMTVFFASGTSVNYWRSCG